MATETINAGSRLSFPFRVDETGSLATIDDANDIVKESVEDILGTRQYERVMLLDYGLPDFVFSVNDLGFAARIKYYLEQQIRDHEPLADAVRILVGAVTEENSFVPGFARIEHTVALSVEVGVISSNSPFNMVWPTWGLKGNPTE